jgi:hypothetical protein
MKPVPILGKLKPRLRFLRFLLFFTELLRLRTIEVEPTHGVKEAKG